MPRLPSASSWFVTNPNPNSYRNPSPNLCLVTVRLHSVQACSVRHACTNTLMRSPAHMQVFDVIGAVMKVPKDDMMGNATAMARFAADTPGKTVQELCEADIAKVGGGDPQKAIKKQGPTSKLLWLSRAMKLIQLLLQKLVEDAEASLSDCVRMAYEASLKQHHGMIKVPPWQWLSSASAPPQGAPGNSGQLGTSRVRPSHWPPSRCLVVHERATSKVADSTEFGHPGTTA
eukprot:scaffold22482_cov69-Phaeocystis_antarctica.AAC.1